MKMTSRIVAALVSVCCGVSTANAQFSYGRVGVGVGGFGPGISIDIVSGRNPRGRSLYGLDPLGYGYSFQRRSSYHHFGVPVYPSYSYRVPRYSGFYRYAPYGHSSFDYHSTDLDRLYHSDRLYDALGRHRDLERYQHPNRGFAYSEPLEAPPIERPYGQGHLDYGQYAAPMDHWSARPPIVDAIPQRDVANDGLSGIAQLARPDQLIESAQRLARSLASRRDDGDVWLDYLRPNMIAESVQHDSQSGSVDWESLTDVLRNYDALSGNADLSQIWTVPGFRQTHLGLQAWLEDKTSATDDSAGSEAPAGVVEPERTPSSTESSEPRPNSEFEMLPAPAKSSAANKAIDL